MMEPWWIKDDREQVARWERMVANRPDGDMVHALGDSRPQTVASLKVMIEERKERMALDIAAANAGPSK